MSTPTEHKTFQARILAHAEAIGWTFVSQKEAEQRRGFDPPSPKGYGGTSPETPIKERAKGRTLFFEDLLDAKVREFNPRYAEAEGALPGQFRHLHTDIRGNREFPVRRESSRRERREHREDLDYESLSSLRSLRLAISEFFDHEEKRERDLILKRKRRLRKFPETASRPRIPTPERLNHRERRERKEDLDSESLSSLCSLRLLFTGPSVAQIQPLNCPSARVGGVLISSHK